MRTVEQRETVQKVVNNRLLRAQLWLVQNHIPFDVAFALDATELEAWAIICRENVGAPLGRARYDFDLDQWEGAEPRGDDDAEG